MKICFFTFYYSPDLSAGSFRSEGLVQNLISQMDIKDNPIKVKITYWIFIAKLVLL